MGRNNKSGTWRRRVSEKKQCGKRDQCAEPECVTNKTGKLSKRDFQLVDEEEPVQDTKPNSKKEKSRSGRYDSL